MHAFQQRGKAMQLGVEAALLLDLLDGREHIIAVCAGLSVPLPNEVQLFVEVEPPGILGVAPVDDVDERRDPRVSLRSARRAAPQARGHAAR